MVGSKGERSRQRILEAADGLIYQRGYSDTSFADLAAAAGIPKGNCYYHYQTKDALLADVFARRVNGIREQLVGWDRDSGEPLERLQRFIAMVRDSADELSRYGCPMGTLNSELGKHRPELQGAAREMFGLYRDWLARQFLLLLPERPDAGGFGDHLLAMAQGAAVLGHACGDAQLIRDESGRMEAWLASVAAGEA